MVAGGNRLSLTGAVAETGMAEQGTAFIHLNYFDLPLLFCCIIPYNFVMSVRIFMGGRGRHPLHRQCSLCLLEFHHDKIHRLLRGVSSSQKISGITLIFGNPIFFAHVTFVIHTIYQK